MIWAIVGILCICMIALAVKVEQLRRETDHESSRERALRKKEFDTEAAARRKQNKELRKRIYRLERQLHKDTVQ